MARGAIGQASARGTWGCGDVDRALGHEAQRNARAPVGGLHSGPTPRGSPLAVAILPWERALKSTSASIRRIVTCVGFTRNCRQQWQKRCACCPLFSRFATRDADTGQLANLRHSASCQELLNHVAVRRQLEELPRACPTNPSIEVRTFRSFRLPHHGYFLTENS